MAGFAKDPRVHRSHFGGMSPDRRISGLFLKLEYEPRECLI
jgi:hypothetical protein